MPETVESQIKINLRERLGKNSLSFEKKIVCERGVCVSKKKRLFDAFWQTGF